MQERQRINTRYSVTTMAAEARLNSMTWPCSGHHHVHYWIAVPLFLQVCNQVLALKVVVLISGERASVAILGAVSVAMVIVLVVVEVWMGALLRRGCCCSSMLNFSGYNIFTNLLFLNVSLLLPSSLRVGLHLHDQSCLIPFIGVSICLSDYEWPHVSPMATTPTPWCAWLTSPSHQHPLPHLLGQAPVWWLCILVEESGVVVT